MRLNQIRLAGFKSFVDHTALSFPGRLVGVVGPNGCGKSNVIDAVRWVMGESSAKTLRGDSMADVIFNGSATRNPAASAEVELVFTEVRLAQYPNADEVAIKRRLTRDGQSQYFINNVRCRRKDITDIFLGTGLGPRSYSIIEQGMISRFIEAKPDELRSYIEEAAGISKYKDRRRETELRIEHTRENMTRLDDVRMEMDKQLDRLKRQARAAEKYQQLKDAEKLLKAQLLAMRWKQFDDEARRQQDLLDTQNPIQEQSTARLAELSELHDQQRDQQEAAQARFQEVQERFYAQQSEIDRLAQSIEHSRERREQLELDHQETTEALETARATLETDREQLESGQAEAEMVEAELQEVQEQTLVLQDRLQEAEAHWQEWQQQWEDFNRRVADPARRMQVEQQRMQDLQHRLEQARTRLQRLEEENRELDLPALEEQLGELGGQLLEAEELAAQLQETMQSCQEQIVERREAGQTAQAQLHQRQSQLQQAQGRLAALEALQESALGMDDRDAADWLAQRGFDANTPRLAQVLRVESGWERAAETVLGAYLQALCVADLQDLTRQLDSLPHGRLSALDRHIPAALESGKAAPRLLDKIQAEWPLAGLISSIYAADSLAQAYELRSRLRPHESVITPQGFWLGANWLSLSEEMDSRAGVFAREQDIRQLREEVEEFTAQIEELKDRLEREHSELRRLEQTRDQAAAQNREAQQRLTQLKTQQGGHQARLEQMSARARRILAEHNELSDHIRRDDTALEDCRAQLLAAQFEAGRLEQERAELGSQRQDKQARLEQIRQRWQASRDAEHQAAGRLHAARTDLARLRQGIERLQSQVEQLEEKRYDLQKTLDSAQSVETWEQQHAEKREALRGLETELKAAREAVQQGEAALRRYEEEQRGLENRLNTLRSLLEETRMTYQSNLVRRQTLEEALTEGGLNIENILAELPAEANEAAWVEGIADVEKRTQKLGAINMAALEEYEEQAGRKNNLDTQFKDLADAMALLEEAIQAIDKETRELFLQTLDKVNQGFQTMFPHVFGGGEASLRLTGEDALTSGVAVMARPPGKRNSSIHQLSGGEKALTAVSLVFAIFELNPAPFCMLDEVDAPLDDTNVGRFCKLVTKMSEHVQFVFISHNKIAMEMADQLIGVTMQEQGVSRPVAVDIDLAVEMAAA
jgi:chromosome segregation protein